MTHEVDPNTDHSTPPSSGNGDLPATGRPSIDEVVDRLERLWSSPAMAAVSGENVRGLSFGRYDLQQLRGQGAFGVVYLAVDRQLDRPVAIKVPRMQVLANAEKRGRFESEAAAAAMLAHPGIVTVYEADLTGPTPYIASAFCPGPDLGEWLAGEHPPVSWSDAATFIAQLADAVDYAHSRGVFHRDLKPSNVLLMPIGTSATAPFTVGDGQPVGGLSEADDGRQPQAESALETPLTPPRPLTDFEPKLTDFGLAKLTQVAAADTRSSLLIGTPLYMAPEQLESSPGAPPASADVYSLGCLLYELITGRPPVEGSTYVEMLDRLRDQVPEPLRRLNPSVPRDLERVCAKCLEKNPAARYESAGSLAADLRACVEGSPIQAREASWLQRLGYWSTRPQRIRDAGWYTLCVQLLLVAWTGITLLGSQHFDAYTTFEQSRLAIDFVGVIGVVNVPMIFAAWYTTRRRPWAIYAGFLMTLINMLLPPAFVAITDRLFFAAIYEKIDSSHFYAFSSGLLVLLAELGQLALYAAAIVAWRKMPQNRREAA